MDQSQRIEELERHIRKDSIVIQQLLASKSELEADIEDLDNENTGLLARMDSVEETIDYQTTTIDRIFDLLSNGGSIQDMSHEAGTMSRSKTKGTRDNALNVCCHAPQST